MVYQQRGIIQLILFATIPFLLLISGCKPTVATDELRSTQPVVVQPTQITVLPVEHGMIEPTVAFEITTMNTTTVQIESRSFNETCLHLASRLYELYLSDDPETFARANGLYFEDNTTRVIIEISEPGVDISFLSMYEIQIETQTKVLVQALIPITKLCDLSNDPKAKAINEPREVIIP